jgi:hypothetical protein
MGTHGSAAVAQGHERALWKLRYGVGIEHGRWSPRAIDRRAEKLTACCSPCAAHVVVHLRQSAIFRTPVRHQNSASDGFACRIDLHLDSTHRHRNRKINALALRYAYCVRWFPASFRTAAPAGMQQLLRQNQQERTLDVHRLCALAVGRTGSHLVRYLAAVRRKERAYKAGRYRPTQINARGRSTFQPLVLTMTNTRAQRSLLNAELSQPFASFKVHLTDEQVECLSRCAKGISLRFEASEIVDALVAGGYCEVGLARVVTMTATGHLYLQTHRAGLRPVSRQPVRRGAALNEQGHRDERPHTALPPASRLRLDSGPDTP